MNANASKNFYVNFFGKLGSMMAEGVPLTKALQASRSGLSHRDDIVELIRKMEVCLENGMNFTDCLKATALFPESILEKVMRGESGGNLDCACKEISDSLLSGSLSIENVAGSQPGPEIQSSDEKREHYVKLTNRILINAISAGASDIHIDPSIETGRIRYRMDGVLHTQPDGLSREDHLGVISRLKRMANLDVGEHKLPQDGRILMRSNPENGEAATRHMDLRVSVCPYIRGEKAVIRILDKSHFPKKFEEIGLTGEQLATVNRWLGTSHGLIIVSGPTGSGKTTTLYLMLSQLAAQEAINVVSIEHPVEYILDNVYQMQVEPALGLTFTAAIRSILRQDPDVISVGEIRDAETAHILAQAAQTGHLALSQLHSHDAVSALKLLYDLGIPEYSLKEIVTGIASQRLVRKLCTHCKTPLTENEKKDLPEEFQALKGAWFKPVGCEQCHRTGYRGRAMILELLEPQKKLWDALAGGASREALGAALPEAFRSLKKDGVRLAAEGVTSVEELMRVLG